MEVLLKLLHNRGAQDGLGLVKHDGNAQAQRNQH
jgi:hypothetical protein